jgi:hypothetical protein
MGVDFAKDYGIIQSVYGTLKTCSYLNFEFASRTSVRSLMDAVYDLVNNQLWVMGGKLQS